MPRVYLLLLLVLPHALALAGQAAVTVREVELKSSPSAAASTIVELPKQSSLEISQRQGAWYQVRTANGDEGWLKLITVRYARSASTGPQKSLLARLSGSSATTGVRGLDEESFSQSAGQGNVTTDRFAASEEEARAFAREAGLVSRKIEYYVP